MNLMAKGPLGLKEPTPAADPAHLERIRALPCIVCWAHGLPQNSATTAHHPICGRYSRRRVADKLAIPLCDGHHQGDFDTSKIAIHRDRTLWVETYGPDTDWIAITQDMLAGEAAL